MIIDKEPIFNSVENSFTVSNNVDGNSDITIFINGIIELIEDSVESVDGNTIYLISNIELDPDDEYSIIFNEI